MKTSYQFSKFSKGRLVRAVALLFLLHTGVDLVFPQLCSEEPVRLAMNQSSNPSDDTSGDYQAAAALMTSNESEKNPRREESPRDEDCFCCCTHVMPSPLFVDPSVADTNLGKNIQPNIALTSEPLNTPDHPPRFV